MPAGHCLSETDTSRVRTAPAVSPPAMSRARRQQGVVVVVIVALLAIVTTLFAVWARAAVIEHRQVQMRFYEIQARQLAEAGIQRAVARIRLNRDYGGELWQLTAEQLGGRRNAEVEINVQRSDQPGEPHEITATAEFPAGPLHHARHTSRQSIHMSEFTDEQSTETET